MINTWHGEIHTGVPEPMLGRKELWRKRGQSERRKNAKCERGVLPLAIGPPAVAVDLRPPTSDL